MLYGWHLGMWRSGDGCLMQLLVFNIYCTGCCYPHPGGWALVLFLSHAGAGQMQNIPAPPATKQGLA
jgi:hypothetical protein